MTIDEMIKILQRIRTEHGNLEVFHSDSESGNTETGILLCKDLCKEQMTQDQTQEDNVEKYVCII